MTKLSMGVCISSGIFFGIHQKSGAGFEGVLVPSNFLMESEDETMASSIPDFYKNFKSDLAGIVFEKQEISIGSISELNN